MRTKCHLVVFLRETLGSISNNNLREIWMSINGPLIDKARFGIKAVCLNMVAERVTFVYGARRILELEPEARLGDDDPDIRVFSGICSEADEIPSPKALKLWSKEAIKQHKHRWDNLEHWAKDYGSEACRNIIARF